MPHGRHELFVPSDTTVVERRDTILGLLAEGRTPMSGDTYTAADFRAATKDEVLLASADDAALDRAALRLGRPRRARGQAVRRGHAHLRQLDQGGLRVTTTLDTKLQKIAEKWVKAATIVPHAKDPAATPSASA